MQSELSAATVGSSSGVERESASTHAAVDYARMS
jgi:hypothetical protein